MNNNFKNQIFLSLLYSNDCPDDDTMFLSPQYIKWADEFSIWLDSQSKNMTFSRKYIRSDHNDCVVFHDDQECIWFTSDKSVCPWIKNVIEVYVHSMDPKTNEEDFRYEP